MERERTPFEIMYFAVYPVFEGLSFRACAIAIQPLEKRIHEAIWDWYQDIGSDKSFHILFRLGRERVKIFTVDMTGITVAGEAIPIHSIRAIRGQNPWDALQLESELNISGDIPS